MILNHLQCICMRTFIYVTYQAQKKIQMFVLKSKIKSVKRIKKYVQINISSNLFFRPQSPPHHLTFTLIGVFNPRLNAFTSVQRIFSRQRDGTSKYIVKTGIKSADMSLVAGSTVTSFLKN